MNDASGAAHCDKTVRTIIPFGVPLNEVKQNSKKGFDERVVWDKF